MLCRNVGKGVESLVEASAAEAEAISVALAAAAAKARERNPNLESQLIERDRGAEATSSGSLPISTSFSPVISIKASSVPAFSPPAGVRLHHRAVRTAIYTTADGYFRILVIYLFLSGHMCFDRNSARL